MMETEEFRRRARVDAEVLDTWVEAKWIKLKQFRRIATRYEKTAQNYLAMIALAVTGLWLR